MSKAEYEDVEKKLCTAYFIAKYELSFRKYPHLLSLDRKKGINHAFAYSNHKAAIEFVSIINDSMGIHVKYNTDLITNLNSKSYNLFFKNKNESLSVSNTLSHISNT